MYASSLLIVLVLLALAAFWGSQIASVINRDDASYKGKHDKWMWFLIVTFTGALGALVYWLTKPQLEVPQHEGLEDDDELSTEELKSIRAAK